MEIKFRAWIKDQKRMYYLDMSDIKKDDLVEDENWMLMQFTGLLDSNGKEIYERDIVIPAPNEYDEPPFAIEFNEGCFTLSRPHTLVRTFWEIGFQMEVIGNVTEDPELLEEKK